MDDRGKIVAVVGFGLVLSGLLTVLAATFHGQPDSWIAYIGTLAGGVLSGVATIIGVIYAFSLDRGRDRKVEKEKQQNQLRLIIYELKEIRNLLMALMIFELEKQSGEDVERENFSAMMHLQTDMWRQLRVNLTWLSQEHFEKLADVYTQLHIIYTNWLQNRRVPEMELVDRLHNDVDNILISFGEDTDFHLKRQAL